MNNLTRIYTESPMLQAVVSTVAIYGGLAEGVSGAELREWLVFESEPDGNANGTLESDTAAPDARIAELIQQRDAAVEAYGELEREIAEKHMKLPVDAEGVPIRLGDTVREADDRVPMKVMSLTFYEDCVDVNACGMNPNLLRHVKSRPIEDVLATFRFDAKNIYDDPTLNGNERADELEALDADVAAELRDLMEANNG